MLNRNKARTFGKEYATVHAADITSVLKPSNSEPNMRRSSPQSDLHLNNLAEKIPIHYRSSKKPMVPAPACAHDLSCTDFEDEESSRGSKSQIARMSPKGAKPSNFLPGDRVIFAESPSAPGIPVVYRTPEERTSNLDRLNLDRRKLTVCPILEGEEQLRLLNYQHNMISKIQHLSVLKRLIFLDLYDNHIEEISGLSSLKSLRVLMLGKNRIKQIENLEALTKLDVLDLHGNQISRIENLTHLSELRVLNLAGNQIVHVDNLSGMDALAELNLRRNRIRTVVDVDSLPNLQRLFLSFNDIAVFDDISCLSESSSLSEISLDGNPIAQDQYYKQIILRHMQQLRQLDMKRVSEEERRIALVMSRKEDEKRREMNKLAIMKEKRRIAINNAKRQWEVMQGSLFSRTSKLVKTSAMPELYASHVGTFSNQDLMGHLGYDRDSQYDREDSDTITSEKRGSRPESAYSVSTDLSQEMVRDQHRPSSKTKEDSRPPALKETMIFGSVRKEEPGQGSDVSNLAELDGDTLSLYGPQSLEAFDKPWGMQAAGAVGTIVFKFIDFEEICKYLHKIRTRFPSTQTLVFSATNIHSLQQINALSSVRRLDNLTIDLDGNSVTKFTLWRMYTVFRLAHFSLKKINDVEVSASDIVNAEKLFGPLSHVTTSQLPKSRLLSLLGETRRKQLLAFNEEKARKTGDTKQAEKAQAELVGRAGLTYLSPDSRLLKQQDADAKRMFAKSVLCELIKEAVFSDRKRAELQRLWPQIFHDMIQQCLSEMNTQQANVKQCLCDMEKV